MDGQYNMRNPGVKRLMKEAQELKEPTEQFAAHPLDDNLFEWHFTIRGPDESEFSSGIYHGRIILPPEYPMKPPSIILLTPNGRFETYKKICLSISGHHPESWQPSWSIRTALLAIIGFMPTHGNGAIGSLDYSKEEREKLAKSSHKWQCPVCGPVDNILKEVTEASDSLKEEAKQLAKEVGFEAEKPKTSNAEPASLTETPSTTSASAQPPNPFSWPNMTSPSAASGASAPPNPWNSAPQLAAGGGVTWSSTGPAAASSASAATSPPFMQHPQQAFQQMMMMQHQMMMSHFMQQQMQAGALRPPAMPSFPPPCFPTNMAPASTASVVTSTTGTQSTANSTTQEATSSTAQQGQSTATSSVQSPTVNEGASTSGTPVSTSTTVRQRRPEAGTASTTPSTTSAQSAELPPRRRRTRRTESPLLVFTMAVLALVIAFLLFRRFYIMAGWSFDDFLI